MRKARRKVFVRSNADVYNHWDPLNLKVEHYNTILGLDIGNKNTAVATMADVAGS